MTLDMKIKPTGDVDRDFVAMMMVAHHHGAIDTAVAVLRYGRNEQIRRLAQEVIVTLQQEIAAMRLAVREPLPASAKLSQNQPARGRIGNAKMAEDSVDGQHHGEEHQTTLASGDWPDHHADDQIEQPEQESQGESLPATYGKGVDGLGDTSDDDNLGERTLQHVIQITICPSVCPWRAQAEPPSHRGWLAAPPLGLGETEQWHSSAGSCGDAAQGAHFSQRT
jgi:hypothetical protein